MDRMSDSRARAGSSAATSDQWEMSPREVAARLKKRDADFVLVDCRTRDEWDAGHVEGAMLVPMQELSIRLADLREHEDKSIVVMCRSGQRSCTVATVLRAEGFSSVRFMSGGILRWIADVDSSIHA